MPAPTNAALAPVDLDAARRRRQAAYGAVAGAPVRYVPAAFLEALQDSWGTPEELGLAAAPERHLRLVAG